MAVTADDAKAIPADEWPAKGYSIVNAESMKAVTELAKGCPMLEDDEKGTVRVYEALSKAAARFSLFVLIGVALDVLPELFGDFRAGYRASADDVGELDAHGACFLKCVSCHRDSLHM